MNINKRKIITAISASVLVIAYSCGLFYAGTLFRPPAQAEAEPRFTVMEYNGAIAVFEPGCDLPQKILGIEVSTLRSTDRQRFREGITVDSLRELAELEEDFSS